MWLEALGCRVQDLVFRCSGFRVLDLGFRGLRLKADNLGLRIPVVTLAPLEKVRLCSFSSTTCVLYLADAGGMAFVKRSMHAQPHLGKECSQWYREWETHYLEALLT